MTQSIGASASRSDVLAALHRASAATGSDFAYLLKTATRESGLDPRAEASTSSATGLFQFTEASWLSVVGRHGERHGVDARLGREALLDLRKDPDLSARMAAEFTRDNAVSLEGAIGRPPTTGELYAAHFLGAGGAARLIRAAKDDPGASAVALFPQAAAANRTIFYQTDGLPVTAEALYQRLTQGETSVAVPGAGGVSAARQDRLEEEASVLARLAGGGLASTLMAALLDLQSDA